MTLSDGWVETTASDQLHEHMKRLQNLICTSDLSDDLVYLEENLTYCLNYIYALKVEKNG